MTHTKTGRRRPMKAMAMALALLAGTATLGGCASVGVKPWQRELLSREDMQLDANPLDGAMDEHMYFSQEASSGGRGFGGGGCGCN
jgi:Domain of unknown function (DUF4266)